MTSSSWVRRFTFFSEKNELNSRVRVLCFVLFCWIRKSRKMFQTNKFSWHCRRQKGFFFIKNRAILGLLFFILVFSAQIFNRFDSKYNLQIIGFESQSDPSTNCPKKVFVKRDLFKTSLNWNGHLNDRTLESCSQSIVNIYAIYDRRVLYKIGPALAARAVANLINNLCS